MLAALATAGRAARRHLLEERPRAPGRRARPPRRPFFERVEAVADPGEALARARELAGDDGAVLVTGSLYLLADLAVRLERVPWGSSASG